MKRSTAMQSAGIHDRQLVERDLVGMRQSEKITSSRWLTTPPVPGFWQLWRVAGVVLQLIQRAIEEGSTRPMESQCRD